VRVGRGSRVVGRKIGATSTAVQAQLGIGQPDFGILFDDMAHSNGATVVFDSVLQPRVEAEVAFVLGADLDDDGLDLGHVRRAVSHVVAAIEICGSRIRDWDITFADTVADNASAGAFVLGSEHRSLDEVEPATVSMSMRINEQVASTGSGAACLGDPLNAVLWLARQARALGDPLRAGELVLSGALGPMRPAEPGATVSAHLSGLGEVSLRFNDGD
jgi:2-keto-4-pentenoate hydratase